MKFKKISFVIFFLVNIYLLKAQTTTPLKGVTFGFGIGYSYLFNNPNQYFLTTDITHQLQTQALNKSSIVISSLVSVKLGKISQLEATGKKSMLVKVGTEEAAGFMDKLALNVAFNLLEVNSGDVAFNKSIDGGIGLGYYVNQFTQISFFFDFIRYRQMRDYFIDNYKGKSIPNGNEILNALDENNNQLYYNKYFPGVSFKVIFSLGNK